MRHVSTLLLALALGCGGSSASSESTETTTTTGDETETIVASEPVSGELGGVAVDGFSASLQCYPGDTCALELTSGMALLRLSLASAPETGVIYEDLQFDAANAIYTDTTGANLSNSTQIRATLRFGDVATCASHGAAWTDAGPMSGELEVRLIDGAGNESLLIGSFSGITGCSPAE